MSSIISSSATQRLVPTASNGTNPVALLAGVAGKMIYLFRLLMTNEGSTGRVMFLKSDTTAITRVYVPGLSSGVLDLNGLVWTDLGEALNLVMADAGVTDVFVSGAALQQKVAS